MFHYYDYDYALTRLLQLRENLEASSCHLEDAVRAKFDEVEHLIRQIGNISEIQPCLLDLQRDQLQLQISFGIPRREIERRFGVSWKTPSQDCTAVKPADPVFCCTCLY